MGVMALGRLRTTDQDPMSLGGDSADGLACPLKKKGYRAHC